MSKAAAFIRKSQGGEDDGALELQRERVPEKAAALADEVATIDLGVHTDSLLTCRLASVTISSPGTTRDWPVTSSTGN